MQDYQNKTESISLSDQKNELEINKLQVEIKQLNTSYFKKVILPAVVQTLIPSLIAAATVLIAYKSYLVSSDERESRIVNKTQNLEILMKNYELIKKKDSLSSDISRFESTKLRLFKDSVESSRAIDSLAFSILDMQKQKKIIEQNIVRLEKDKHRLRNEIDFAPLTEKLYSLRVFPFTNSLPSFQLIFFLQQNHPFQERVVDSLLMLSQNIFYKPICLFILYHGLKNEKYFEQLVTTLYIQLSSLISSRKKISAYTKNLLTSELWSEKDKYKLLAFVSNLYNRASSPTKGDLSEIMNFYNSKNSP